MPSAALEPRRRGLSDLPGPALSHDVMGEYFYTNFPWREIRSWLLPQIAWAKRIVILDGLHNQITDLLMTDPDFPKARVAGVWHDRPGIPIAPGVPVLADEEAIIRARPDLVLSSMTMNSKQFAKLLPIHLMTRAAIFPNLVTAHPFAGSMMLFKGDGTPSGIFQPAFPEILRRSVVRHMARYVAFTGWAKGREVLDIACGNGYGSHLLSRVATQVTGVDLNARLVDYAARHNTAANLRYLCEDLRNLPRDFRVDLVTSVETFEHVPAGELDGFVDALHGFLRPGGTLLCTTPLARETVRNPDNRDHMAEYATEEFVARLSQRFEVEAVLFQDQDSALTAEISADLPTPQSVDPAHIVQIAVARAR